MTNSKGLKEISEHRHGNVTNPLHDLKFEESDFERTEESESAIEILCREIYKQMAKDFQKKGDDK